ncbi:MAG: glycoside hydrolase family 3 C-terminal domain-containing protein [Eubacterium sp.]|nr:glycoside hydrolase family 3 C-terminal domain-containing protein [Eubacterium sp.]
MDYNKARIKAEKLVSLMTAEEKMSQLLFNSPAIERLGIDSYNWWNEACHGVARAGVATVFPQSIGMAATFNPGLVNRVAEAVSTEGRAKYNKSVAHGDRGIYKGLTFWAPNVNIFRDPRWGRGQETCGEDPFLTSQIGTAYIKGLQGDGEFLKAAACAKHFAAHSGPEGKRHSFNAEVSKKDLAETYLPAFEKAVEAGVAGVMGAYNRTNGEPCCASPALMDILRRQWGFRGYFVSDCWAVTDIYEGHKYAPSIKEAAAAALNAGCELNCGDAYIALKDAYKDGLITDTEITAAAVRLFTIRALLGEFEEERPYGDIPYSAVSCPEHKALNLEAARETLVLLENRDSFLPLDRKEKMKIAVVGPNALSRLALEGNYSGHADEYITVADGIRRVFGNAEITVADGASIKGVNSPRWNEFEGLLSEGIAAAEEADITVLCLGLDRTIEGEDLGFENDFTVSGDRRTAALPENQLQLAEAVCNACENVIVVVLCGSCADLGDSVRKRAKAVLHGWYPGALGGLALAQALAGEFSPSGKLPITFYRADTELPDIENYSMKNRTYRFSEAEALYPFGYGLSFTEFAFKNAEIVSNDEEQIVCTAEVTNTGAFDSAVKVQCYAHYTDSRTETPRLQLCALAPEFLNKGETKTVRLEIDKYWLKAVLENGERVTPDGEITLYIGDCQPDTEENTLKIKI